MGARSISVGDFAMILRVRAIALTLLVAPLAVAQPDPEIRVPPDIGAAYRRLGQAIATHDADGARAVWAEDFVVNSPNNTVLTREEVIGLMSEDFLVYEDFAKHITFVSEKPEITVVMGYDTMVPLKGPGAGQSVVRPFTDVWAHRDDGWVLIARQATITSVERR